MAIEIASDADMPKCLDTPSKQITKAQELAQSHSGIPARRFDGPNDKLRPEPMDLECFHVARSVLGASFVPEIGKIQDEELERENIWVYWMTCISGETWGAREKLSPTRVTIVQSLGRILSKGYVDSSSELAIHRKIRPHLELLLASEEPQIRQFHSVTRDLIGKLGQLNNLPLFIAHFDLHIFNIMVNDNCEVSGIIDWELSTPLPFGMGFCIHTLAGEHDDKEFHMPPEFEEAERGFWQELWDGIPENIRSHVNLEAVQIAVTIRTLLDAFQLNEGRIASFSQVEIDTLPKLLTYRIPLLRGPDSPPYSE